MPRINDIVDKINETIIDEQFKDRRFQKGKVYGIAEVNERQDGEFTEVYPVINPQSETGASESIALDDKYPYVMYHRVNDIDIENYLDEDDFGEAKFVRQTYSMVLIVWGNRDKLQLRRDQLLTGLISGFPAHLVRADIAAWSLYGVEIDFGSTNMNAKDVYEQEFTTQKTAIKPNHIMISFEYDCAVTYRQGCIDVCDL